MEQRDYLVILYDYYGELLNEDNKKYFEDYYFDNLYLFIFYKIISISNRRLLAYPHHIRQCIFCDFQVFY